MYDSNLLYGWRVGGVLHTDVCLHHFITLHVNFQRLEDEGWGVGGNGTCAGNGQSEKREEEEEKRRGKEDATTELKMLCLYMRLQAKLITRWSPTPLKC